MAMHSKMAPPFKAKAMKAPKAAPKLEMVANRVVGVAPKASKPMSVDADPSMVRPGHHKYV